MLSDSPGDVDAGRLLRERAGTPDAREARSRRCYIHIGTHKTGTTSIQAFLAANKRRFAEHGVYLPAAGSEDDLGVIAHHELAKELLGNPQFQPARGGLHDVVDELRQTNADVACLTSEDFSFLYDAPQTLIRLRDAILDVGFAPRIVVYLRGQASYGTAVYSESVRHGYRVPFEQYLADVLEQGRYSWGGGFGPPFDYTVLLDAFASVFGAESIVARSYRSAAADNALLFSFARLLAPKADLNSFDIPKIRYNGSLSFRGVLKLLGVEAEVPDTLRFTPVDLGTALRIGARFVLPNLRLARRYGVFVPVLEPIDIALALPLRKTRLKTIALFRARRALKSMPRRHDI